MSSALLSKGKLASLLRDKILFPFLLPVFFVLHIERYYSGAVPVKDVLELIAAYILGAILVYAALRIFIRKKVVAGIITLFLLILFLYWWEIIPFFINTFHTSQNFRNHPLFLLTCLLVISLVAWVISRQKPSIAQKVVFYMNALFLIYVSVEVGLLGVAYFTDKLNHAIIDPQVAQREDAVKPHAGKDIYLLLFDEYASNTSLQDDWHINNREISDYLAAKGFHLGQHTRSNYNLTQFSMTSLFNMDYLQGHTAAVTPVDERDYQYCVPALQYSRVIHVLGRAGYNITPFSLFDIGDKPGSVFFGRLIFKRQLVTNHTFYQITKQFYIPYLISRKEANNPNFFDPAFYQVHTYNQRTLGHLLDKVRQKSTQPQFVYAHFMLPHAPYYYRSDGSLMSKAEIFSGKEKDYYANNVRQANRIMKQVVDSIMQYSNGDAAILITGDHGFRKNYKTDHSQSFPTFNALYFPDKDYSTVPDSLTNVNLFRIVLNKFCGMRYPLLPNKQCFLKEE